MHVFSSLIRKSWFQWGGGGVGRRDCTYILVKNIDNYTKQITTITNK